MLHGYMCTRSGCLPIRGTCCQPYNRLGVVCVTSSVGDGKEHESERAGYQGHQECDDYVPVCTLMYYYYAIGSGGLGTAIGRG
jgi:hypothetical protein